MEEKQSPFFGAGSGLQMTFANGYTVSVQWHNGNHCDNRYKAGDTSRSETAEVAIWNRKGDYVKHPLFHGSMLGSYMTADEVAQIMASIRRKK